MPSHIVSPPPSVVHHVTLQSYRCTSHCYYPVAHSGAQAIALALQNALRQSIAQREKEMTTLYLSAAMLFNPEEELVLWNHDPASNFQHWEAFAVRSSYAPARLTPSTDATSRTVSISGSSS